MMPENFVIHVPHPVSAARIEWINEDKKVRSMTSELTMVEWGPSNTAPDEDRDQDACLVCMHILPPSVP